MKSTPLVPKLFLFPAALVLALLVSGAILPAEAQSTDIWIGGGANANWSTNENWSLGAPPTAGSIVEFAATGNSSLNGTSYTVDSLDFADGSSGLLLNVGSGTPSLTLTSGKITRESTVTGNAVYLYPSIILGTNGVFENDASGGVNAIRLYGSISDGGNGYSLTLRGGGVFQLNAANTYTGGTIVDSSSVYINNNGALGGGSLTFTGGAGGANILANDLSSNAIVINLTTTGQSVGFYGNTGTGATYQTKLGAISSGTNGLDSGALTFDRYSTPASWNWLFSNTVSLTGLNSQGLQLGAVTNGSLFAYVFSSSLSLNGGTGTGSAVQLGSASASTAGGAASLLVDTAGTFASQVQTITVMNGGAADTIGGIQASGTVTYAPASATGGIVLNDTTAGHANFAALNAGTTVDFETPVSGASGVGLHINDSFQRVDSTNTPVTYNPKGTVKLGKSNTYSGGTVVDAGTLLVANTVGSATGTGAVTVQGGASFGGTGIVAPAGTNGVTIQAGGILAPENLGSTALRLDGSGTTAPLLTLDSGATLLFSLGAGGAGDQVDLLNYVAGDLVLNGNLLSITDAGGLGAGTYTLFSFYANGGTTLAASGLSSGLELDAGFLAEHPGSFLDYDTLGEINLVVAAPELSPAWLLAGGAALLLVTGRRRLHAGRAKI